MREQVQKAVRDTTLPRRWNAGRSRRDKLRGKARGLLKGLVATDVGYGFHAGRAVFFGVAPGARLSIGDNVTLYDRVRLNIECPAAQVRIGHRSFLNFGTQVFCRRSVWIGDDTAIAFGCLILDNNLHQLDGDRDPRPVHIGNHVWIGANVTVLPGVTIGDGAVVGAGSVVTRDIPGGQLAVGSPARPVKGTSWVM